GPGAWPCRGGCGRSLVFVPRLICNYSTPNSRTASWPYWLCGNPYRQGLVALDEAGINPLRLIDHLDLVETLEDLLPDDLQLQLGEPHADAAVDAEAERDVRARPRAVDDEIVRLLDHVLVAVARDVP